MKADYVEIWSRTTPIRIRDPRCTFLLTLNQAQTLAASLAAAIRQAEEAK